MTVAEFLVGCAAFFAAYVVVYLAAVWLLFR